MNKWRYQVLEYKIKGGIAREMRPEKDYLTELNALGREGWELVGVIPLTESNGRLSKIHLILKKTE